MTDEPTVFVVDDDEAVSDALSDLLGSVGRRAEVFRSARGFLDACDPERPGCVLLDIRMPGMSGLELQERLRAQGVFIPVIILTGHGDTATAVRAMKAGAFDFIEKPFNEQALLDTVERAITLDLEQRETQTKRAHVASRLSRLTAREQQILNHIVAGQSNRLIAEDLGISEKTVEAHRARVMKKTGVRTLAELVRMTVEQPPGR